MGGGKETPRQKMIGMMYLVLLAMLAMNVSKSILEAFVRLNTGMENTTKNFQLKNDKTYTNFAAALANDKEKTQPYFDAANKVKKEAQEMYDYVNLLKVKVIRASDGIGWKGEEDFNKNALTDPINKVITIDTLTSLDNYDVPSLVLGLANPPTPIDKPGETDYTGLELRRKIEAFETKLRTILKDEKLKDIKPKEVDEMNLGLKIPEDKMENGTKWTWEALEFYHSPAAAVITSLTKVQSDIRNAEATAINKLLVGIGANDFKFDNVVAKVLPKSSYVLQGDKYTADIIVAAYSSTQAPIVELGTVDTTGPQPKIIGTPSSDGITYGPGKGIYEVAASSPGVKKWSGIIKVQKPDGSYSAYKFSEEYIVAKPAATVSADKMNVLYVGVDNPISISAAGIPADDLSPSISGGGGSLRKVGPGKYICTVRSAGKAKINVSAKLDGSSKNMGGMEYRVKRLPDPIAKCGKVVGEGNMNKNMLKVLPGLQASMGDGFAFDLNPQIAGFEMIVSGKGIDPIPYKSNSYAFTPQMKRIFGGLVRGNRVYFQGLKCKMPDGTTRKLSPLSIEVM